MEITSETAGAEGVAAGNNGPRRDVVVAARDVSKTYDGAGETVLALDAVSVEIAAGSFIAIMGASGSGKSTLLHLIAGLTGPTRG